MEDEITGIICKTSSDLSHDNAKKVE